MINVGYVSHASNVVCNITNEKLTPKWGYYKDDSWIALRGEEHKQVAFFGHFQAADNSRFIKDIGIRF